MNFRSKPLIFSTLAALAMMIVPKAPAWADSESMPVMMGTACDYQLRVPENSMGYIPSGDCKTVFVLPSAVGRLAIGSFAPTAHTLLCDGVTEYEQNRVDSIRAIRSLNALLRKTQSEKERKAIQDKIEAISKYMSLGGDVFKDKPAAHAQLVFSNAVDQSILDQWILMNIEVIRSKGVTFRAAPLGTSVLTFNTKQAMDIGESAILYSSIPSLTKQVDGTYKTAIFQGSLSGEVIFSLYGACPLLNKMPTTMSEISTLKVDDVRVGASLIANHSYEVATRSKMKYSAVLKKDAAIDFLNSFQKERANAFSVSELVERHGSGDISDLVDLRLEASEMNSAQLENWSAFKQTFYQDVLTRLTTRMVTELASLQLLELRPVDMEDAPQAGTIQEARTGRQCSSSSVFFGLGRKSSCHDVTIYVPVNVNGRSELIDNQSLKLKVDIRESLEINEPFNYTFTSGFKPVAN